MRSSLLSVAAAAVWLAASGSALQACEGGKTLFEDHFDRLEPTWGKTDESFYVKDGQLLVLPDPDQAYYAFNESGFYDDVTYCVTVVAVNADLAGDSFGGLIFWGVDNDNYYSLSITADGYAAVFRRNKGKMAAQIAWAKFAAIEKGDGASNELSVVTKGKRATVYVNGSRFGQINGQPPKDGWQFGVRAASPKNSRATYGFDDARVAE
jgi:hypothetical protein